MKTVKEKKGWVTMSEDIDGSWQCSRMTCHEGAKYHRDVFTNRLMLREFACTRHATTKKVK